MTVPAVVARLIGWLRAGYPEGVPEHDYIPLFALLSRRLSHDELAEVVADLSSAGYVTSPGDAVRLAIESATKSPPSDEDVARVRRRLEAVGWDFDGTDAA